VRFGAWLKQRRTELDITRYGAAESWVAPNSCRLALAVCDVVRTLSMHRIKYAIPGPLLKVPLSVVPGLFGLSSLIRCYLYHTPLWRAAA